MRMNKARREGDDGENKKNKKKHTATLKRGEQSIRKEERFARRRERRNFSFHPTVSWPILRILCEGEEGGGGRKNVTGTNFRPRRITYEESNHSGWLGSRGVVTLWYFQHSESQMEICFFLRIFYFFYLFFSSNYTTRRRCPRPLFFVWLSKRAVGVRALLIDIVDRFILRFRAARRKLCKYRGLRYFPGHDEIRWDSR